NLDADRPIVTRLVAGNLDPKGLIRHRPSLCPHGSDEVDLPSRRAYFHLAQGIGDRCEAWSKLTPDAMCPSRLASKSNARRNRGILQPNARQLRRARREAAVRGSDPVQILGLGRDLAVLDALDSVDQLDMARRGNAHLATLLGDHAVDEIDLGAPAF